MGHTVEVHQQNYARFMPDNTHAKFEKHVPEGFKSCVDTAIL